MEMLLYTDRKTVLRLFEELPFAEMMLQPEAAWDLKTAGELAGCCSAALVDLDYAGGEELARQLREHSPDMPVITFSDRPAAGTLHCGSRQSTGIAGYISDIAGRNAECMQSNELFWRRQLQSSTADPVIARRSAARVGISPENRYTVVQISLCDRLTSDTTYWTSLTAKARTALIALLTMPGLRFEALTEDRYEGHYWLVLREDGTVSSDLIAERCTLFSEFCRTQILDAGLCWAADCTVTDLAGAVEQIRMACRDAGDRFISDIRSYTMKESGYCSGDLREKFCSLLAEKGAGAFTAALDEILDQYENAGQLNSQLLRMMLPDLEYLLRESFVNKELDISFLMETPRSIRLRACAFWNRDQLLTYILSILHPVQNRFPTASSYPEPVYRAMEYLKENLTEPYSRSDLGQAIGLNPNYLAALFKEATGQSISSWRGKLQMERAVKLLTETDLPISQVAEQSGFGDPGYFNNAFRKQYGIPPGLYRQKNRR